MRYIFLFFMIFSLIFFAFMFVAYGGKRRFFNNKMLRQLRVILRNHLDYLGYLFHYEWRNNKVRCLLSFLRIFFLMCSVSSVFGLLMLLLVNLFIKSNFEIDNTMDFLNTISVICGACSIFIDYITNYEHKFIRICVDQNAYYNVQVPDNTWERIDYKSDKHFSTWDLEQVYVNHYINQWLRSTKEISLSRCKTYERLLMKQIYDEKNWKEVYSLFLKQNHLKAMSEGRQFYNERKFGISNELDPSMQCVKIHKTCYFDSYLTNIIPGKMLVRSDDGKIISTATSILPYEQKGSERRLLNIKEEIDNGIFRANEPGVSTLLLLPNGQIVFWRQNYLAQGSAGRIAPSGSGSSDWEDCKKFMKDSNGFRKAIVYGMQRELWEESYSFGNIINQDDFMRNVETRLIGQFKWLQKAGKYEFIGITRFLNRIPGCNNPYPSDSEVTYYDKSARISTIEEALNLLPIFENQSINVSDSIEIKDYSIPCVMAIRYLRELCEDYIKQHPGAGQDDWQKALFPDGTAIRITI